MRIRMLRSQGMGYRSIAKAMNMTRDNIRRYCQRRGLGGFRLEYEMNVKERMADGRARVFCGAELVKAPTGRPKRFCSDLCRNNYWRAHRTELKKKAAAIYTMQCRYCHETFESYGNKTRKYCCHEHYILDRFGQEESRAVPMSGAAFLMRKKELGNGV